MKKIKFLLNELGYGGTENQVVNLVNSLSDLYKIEIICLKKKTEYNLNKKIALTELNVKDGIIGVFYDNRLVNAINNIIGDADILVMCDPLYNRILDKLDFDNKDIIYWLQDEIDKDINKLKKYNKVILPNKYLHDKYNLDNCMIISNSIVLNEKKTNYELNNRIVSVGKLNKNKCFEDLINVIEMVVEENSKVVLDIIGDGDERNNIVSLIKSRNLTDNVHLLGSLTKNELLDVLIDANVFVSTSNSNNFILSVLEAMNVGLPVVAFKNLGNEELITDDIDGVLIENRNLIEMKNAILDLINDKVKSQNLGGCAVEKSMNFDINVIKMEWIKIFK